MPRETTRKRITSDELIAQINPRNMKLVERFLKNFETRRSPSSVKVYKSNFDIFFCWNLDNNDNKFFTDIKKIEFMDFFDFAASFLEWSPARYAQMWSSLNSLSTFIENYLDDEYPEFKNQVRKIEKIPKSAVRKKTILTSEQVENLLHYLYTEIGHKQEACLLALLAFSGVRIAEAFEFTTDIIDIDNVSYNGLFLETTEQIKTKGRGKNGKKLHKYILKEPFLPYYLDWIQERGEFLDSLGIDHNSLFIKTDGTPAQVTTARSWIKKWEKYLTETEPSNTEHKQIVFYPHCMRHWFCTYLARKDIPQELIVELFGWSSAEMYQIYNDLTAKDREWKNLDNLRDL